MSENIAGYIDRSYIKGQTYRYAATPAPIVFTGNIDEISDNDLLSKAMLVSRGQISGGKLPNEFGNTFLITTVKYGNNTYLQTAYLVQSGYECWEYRRIYSGGWTEWIGVDSAIKNVDGKIQDVKNTADSANAAINGTNGINSKISDINTKINIINNTTIPSLSGDIDQVKGRIGDLETNTSMVPISYTIKKTSGAWSCSSVNAYRCGNIVYIHFPFYGSGAKVNAGSNAFLGALSNGPLPLYGAKNASFIASGSPVLGLGSDGTVTVRITGAAITLASGAGHGIPVMFFTGNTSNQNQEVEASSLVEEFPVIPFN
jgi:hypothetical protein